MRFHLFLIVGLLTAADASAGSVCPGETTREMEVCLAEQRDDANAELERYRAEVLRLLSDRPMVKDAFAASQVAWLEYSQAECRAVYELWKEGSVRNIQLLGCQEHLARQRTWQLWSTYLRGMATDLSEPLRERSQ